MQMCHVSMCGLSMQVYIYGTPFSHLFTELKISPIEVHIEGSISNSIGDISKSISDISN